MRWLIALSLILLLHQTSYAASLPKVNPKWLKLYPNSLQNINLLVRTGKFSKAENIDGILYKAIIENKVPAAKERYLAKKYGQLENGDKDLLFCIKLDSCDLDKFNSLMSDLPRSSSIYRDLAYKYPNQNKQFLIKQVGNINESVMTDYYVKSGWKNLEGEIGVHGIDGLFVKMKNGVVRDVLIVEGKFNTSQLGTTKNGMQMSKPWIQNHLENLVDYFPNNKSYKQVKMLVDGDSYRSVLWNMNVTDNRLEIITKKVISRGSVVETVIDGSSNDISVNRVIDMNAPKNNFEKNIVESFQRALGQSKIAGS